MSVLDDSYKLPLERTNAVRQREKNEGIVGTAVHDALQKSEKDANEAIERIGNIRVLNTPALKHREEMQALYKKLERMQAKTRLLDEVVDDEYVPVTDEIIEDLDNIMARVSALI